MHITNANIANLFLDLFFCAECQKYRDLLCAIFINFFSYGIICAIRWYLRKENGRESRDRSGRVKRIVDSTSDITAMNRLSLRGKCICARAASEYSRSRRRTARQRQIMRGFHWCIPFMQIFMKFSWSGRDTSREVRAMSSRACPRSTDMLR